MPKPLPDDKKDNSLKDTTESKSLTKKSPSPPSAEASTRCIEVETFTMAGLMLSHQGGEVQRHDSFGHGGLRPKKVTPTSRPKSRVESVPRKETKNHVVGHNAHHGGCAGSEFPKDDATSTASVAFVASPHKETSGSTSSGLLPAHYRKQTSSPSQQSQQSQQYRRQASASQYTNFASLFAKKKKNFRTTIPPTAQEEQEDTIMSIEKVLPDQQVVSSAKKTHRKRTPQRKAGQTAGRWTNQEHHAFLDGLKEFGREWKKVATRIPTRTSAQIRSHAQKYFAKLQRDQETIMSLNSSATSETQNGMMDPPPPQQPLTPSVQKKMERLMADPQAVQREVEDTLQALREHYRQLQAQLERKRKQQQQQGSIGGYPRKPMLLQPAAPIIAPEETEVEVSSVGSRKRTLQEMELESTASSQQQAQQQQQQQQQDHDDHSSVTTNISASVASLDDEELIALHVLGGALPRNDSHASMRDLPSAVSSALFKQDSPASQQSKKTKTIESPTKDNNNNNQE